MAAVTDSGRRRRLRPPRSTADMVLARLQLAAAVRSGFGWEDACAMRGIVDRLTRRLVRVAVLEASPGAGARA
jgi:hypothetical protein